MHIVRRTRIVFPSVPSCEWYLGHCAADLLCDTRDDSPSMARENCSCTVIFIHFNTHGSGAVALIRSACPCTAAEAGAALVDVRLLGRPRPYGGNSQEWNAFKFVFKTYIGAVAHPMFAAMIHAETLNEPVFLSGLSPENAQLSRSLSFLLAQLLSGPPLQLMMNMIKMELKLGDC